MTTAATDTKAPRPRQRPRLPASARTRCAAPVPRDGGGRRQAPRDPARPDRSQSLPDAVAGERGAARRAGRFDHRQRRCAARPGAPAGRTADSSSSPANGAGAPRSWRARQTIPAILRQVSDEQAMEITIVENLQRADLNPMEQARAFERLSREFHMTQEQMAQRTGKDRATVANFLRLLKLPDSGAGPRRVRRAELWPCAHAAGA